MPTNKPKIQVILEEDIYNILKELSDKEMRSISQMGGFIITKYIKEYESESERAIQKGKLSESKIG